jgi:ubiquinone/menaquinone biosynthesis C-methylase UbiE
MKRRSLHSLEMFTPSRNDWWNADYLKLFQKRWNFKSIRSILDVGCGRGHWIQSLFPLFKGSVSVVGIDRENKHIQFAQKLFSRLKSTHSFSFRNACCESLPFPDNSFDLVTCQTLLIHVPDPLLCLNEMKRVAKPGGLIACCEPNNLFRAVSISDYNLKELKDRIGFEFDYQAGKLKERKGFDSYGELAVHDFFKIGLVDIQVFLSDKCSYVIPPYSKPYQRRIIEEINKDYRTYSSGLTPDDIRFASKGGRTSKQLSHDIEYSRAEKSKIRKEIKAKQYISAGVSVMLMTSGRKPNAPLTRR